MRKFLTFYCLLLVVITLALILMTSCNGCILGDACSDFWRVPATMTAEAK
jgi:hypothetical protein